MWNKKLIVFLLLPRTGVKTMDDHRDVVIAKVPLNQNVRKHE